MLLSHEEGDLLADLRALDVGGAEVDAAPHPCVDDLLQSVGEPVEVPGPLGSPTGKRPECTSNSILSVPKNSRSVLRTDPLTQPCPEGWSGNGGVASGGVVCVDGWNSGSQLGSPTVSGLPSFAASWIAALGRQKCQCHLSFQQLIAPSAAARFTMARRRASSTTSSSRLAETSRVTRFQSTAGANCQKIAAVVWSAVLVVLFSAPKDFTSSKSFAYFLLVSALGPFDRNCEGLSMRNGFAFPTEASGSSAVGVTGLQSPASGPITRLKSNDAKYPSFSRAASIAAAAASPARTPSSSTSPSGTPSSVAWYAASSPAT